MLPMPGAASSSWSLYRARIAALFERSILRVAIAFWLLGLINNVLYVIILSAALDLVGPSIPKSLVLLFDVIPSFLLKLIAPYYIHVLSYRSRVLILVTLSTCGMLLIALTPSSVVALPDQKPGISSEQEILVKMSGVVLASLSSGGGELSFLGLTSRYGHTSLAAWGSGTGAAGFVGAGAYVLATTTFGLSVKSSLFAFSFLPIIMVFSFFVILPAGLSNKSGATYQPVEDEEEEAEIENESRDDTSGLLAQSHEGSPARSHASRYSSKRSQSKLKANLRRARGLVLPYMLPLFMVYVAEYTINQGVSPTLLFPLKESPFSQYRSFYPTYNALYQMGVFISRSSLPFIHIDSLYTPSFLQFINLAALAAHAIHPYIPTVYFVFVVVFWEGLLGGLVYVSTFRRIGEEIPSEDREFSLGAATVSDSAGICVAGFLGMVMETSLCNWQVAHGRDWCRRL